MKLKAFTLAEVLITLAIIGIVAALTIPSVISNYQQQEFKTGLKKAVSVLNEAIQTNIAQEGETPYENQDLFNYFKRHMSVIKTRYINHCADTVTGRVISLDDNEASCYDRSNAKAINNKVMYTADGMRFEFAPRMGEGFILHETGVAISSDGHNDAPNDNITYCGSYGLSNNPHNTKTSPCIVTVDVNGDKKPNPSSAFVARKEVYNKQFGNYSTVNANQSFEYTYPSPSDKKLLDIFSIMITDEKAIPFGVVAQRAMYSK